MDNRVIQKLTDAKVGETVEFLYRGYNNVDKLRLVKVTEVAEHGIKGFDRNVGETPAYRQFRNDGVVPHSTIIVVNSTNLITKVIDFKSARQFVCDNMTGEQLAEFYGKVAGVKNARFGIDPACVYYDVEYEPERIEVDDTYHDAFAIYNSNDGCLDVELNNGAIYCNGTRCDTPKELLEILQQHLTND